MANRNRPPQHLGTAGQMAWHAASWARFLHGMTPEPIHSTLTIIGSATVLTSSVVAFTIIAPEEWDPATEAVKSLPKRAIKKLGHFINDRLPGDHFPIRFVN